MTGSDRAFMREALELARTAGRNGEVPVGAVLAVGGRKIGWGENRGRTSHDPTAHAEIVALRMAAASCENYRIPGSTLYVTVEPCLMCFGALLEARVARLCFGAREPRRGVAGSVYDLHNDPRMTHKIEVEEGFLDEESRSLMQAFFAGRRGDPTPRA